MITISIIILIISLIVLCIGIYKIKRASLWKRIVHRQEQLINTQREVLDTQRITIERYKDMLSKGVYIVTNDQKN